MIQNRIQCHGYLQLVKVSWMPTLFVTGIVSSVAAAAASSFYRLLALEYIFFSIRKTIWFQRNLCRYFVFFLFYSVCLTISSRISSLLLLIG